MGLEMQVIFKRGITVEKQWEILRAIDEAYILVYLVSGAKFLAQQFSNKAIPHIFEDSRDFIPERHKLYVEDVFSGSVGQILRGEETSLRILRGLLEIFARTLREVKGRFMYPEETKEKMRAEATNIRAEARHKESEAHVNEALAEVLRWKEFKEKIQTLQELNMSEDDLQRLVLANISQNGVKLSLAIEEGRVKINFIGE